MRTTNIVKEEDVLKDRDRILGILQNRVKGIVEEVQPGKEEHVSGVKKSRSNDFNRGLGAVSESIRLPSASPTGNRG